MDPSDYLEMIEDCFDREDQLTVWEFDFIGSVKKYIEEIKIITEKQAAKVEEIWERVTQKG